MHICKTHSQHKGCPKPGSRLTGPNFGSSSACVLYTYKRHGTNIAGDPGLASSWLLFLEKKPGECGPFIKSLLLYQGWIPERDCDQLVKDSLALVKHHSLRGRGHSKCHKCPDSSAEEMARVYVCVCVCLCVNSPLCMCIYVCHTCLCVSEVPCR